MQNKSTPNTTLWAFINDIRRFLQSQEDEEEYKTNKYFIRIEYLFHGLVIKSWFRTNFSSNEYTEYNRIIIKHYMNFYVNCWYYRNEVA